MSEIPLRPHGPGLEAMKPAFSKLRTRLLLARRYRHMYHRFVAPRLDFSRRRAEFYHWYWHHAAREVGATVRDLGENYLGISRDGSSTIVQFHFVDLDTYFAKALMDDKRFVSDLVRELGFSSPRFSQFKLTDRGPAHRFMEEVGVSCVVKPRVGSGGTGVTTGITDGKRLTEAALAASIARSLPTLLIEEQVPGDSYRLLYLDGELLHAVKRGACTVRGDGTSSIKRLVGIENARRLGSDGIESMSELTVDLDMKYTLADQGLTPRSVPGPGELVRVKNVSNQNSARDQEDVTDRVHHDYHSLPRGVFDRVGARLVGIDVMCEDISRGPADSVSAINEINIPPGLHYHEILLDQDRPSRVGPAILSRLLSREETARPIISGKQQPSPWKGVGPVPRSVEPSHRP